MTGVQTCALPIFFVKDIIKVLIKSMDKLFIDEISDIYNVGTGKSISIDYLFKKLSGILNYSSKPIYKPLPEGDPDKSSGKFHKLTKNLSINLKSFTKFEEGLELTVNYFKGVFNEKI